LKPARSSTAGFLELVRYGIRRADDPLMVDSLKVVDAVLKRDLPQGPGWLRYNWDGYGQGADGGPFHGYGQGRVWPLLTGERAHYELAAGRDVSDLIKTYEGYATPATCSPSRSGTSPTAPISPEIRRPRRLRLSAGLGSRRVPEAAALRLDGKVFDRIEPVYQRYGRFQSEHNHARSEHHGRAHQKCIEMFSQRRPIQTITPRHPARAGREALRPGLDRQWLADHQLHAKPQPGQRRIRRGHPARHRETPGAGLSLTFFWPEENRWLGHNYEIRIEVAGSGAPTSAPA
jgi:glucoamylase